MRFITEMHLRDSYKIDPFSTYVLEPDTKLTPGARQFLVDRRITVVQAQGNAQKSQPMELKRLPGRESWSVLGLRRRMDCIEALFLLVAAELLHSGNTVVSQEIRSLGRCFGNVQEAERSQKDLGNIQFSGWPAEEIKKCSDDLDIKISDFHLGLKNGKELAMLNHLYASLREIEPDILEAYWSEEKQICLRQDLIDTVNRIINILGIIIRDCLGGEKCKL